jgi:hypothetical protein
MSSVPAVAAVASMVSATDAPVISKNSAVVALIVCVPVAVISR